MAIVDYNQKLSEIRVLSIKDKLVELGISSQVIFIIGMGAKKPIADNDTPEGRSTNRRVEIKIVKNTSNKHSHP